MTELMSFYVSENLTVILSLNNHLSQTALQNMYVCYCTAYSCKKEGAALLACAKAHPHRPPQLAVPDRVDQA